MKNEPLFDATSAFKLLQDARKLNEARATRVLRAITQGVKDHATKGVLHFGLRRKHVNEIIFRAPPETFAEAFHVWWREPSNNSDQCLSIYVNDNDLKFVIDKLKELGYSIFGQREAHGVYEFSISWT